MAASDLTYFGDESAGTFLPDDYLTDTSAADFLNLTGAQDLPTPGQVKHQLELALINFGVHVLYGVRPVAVIQDQKQHVRGVLFAARTSLYAVMCKCVVDATRQGLVAKLAGVKLNAQRELSDNLNWVVLAPDAPASELFAAQTLSQPFRASFDKRGMIDIARHTLTLPRPKYGTQYGASIAERAAAEHQLRNMLNHPQLWGAAEIIVDAPSEYVTAACGLQNDPLSLPDAVFEQMPGLLLMNGALPLTSSGVAQLERVGVQIKLGERLGALAAANARENIQNVSSSVLHLATGSTQESKETYGFAPSFTRHENGDDLVIPAAAWPQIGDCDVVVAGGGTGGAAAGISAARAQAKTIVLEVQHALGGVGTLGMIGSYWFGNRVGFSNEIDNRVHEMMGDPHAENKSRWNTNVKDICLQKMLAEAGGRAWLGSFAFGVQKRGGHVCGLLVSTPYGCGLLKAKSVVDATGNADIAAAAGAPCRTIDQYHVAVQGTGLSPRNPGVGSYNSDHTFIDDNDVAGITHAFITTREKFKSHFDIAPLVGSRERRQIHGEIELSPLDFLAHRTFPDTICTARSNFDTHGFTVHPVFMVVPPGHDPLMAHVPFRCMLPLGVDNVLVTGLGMSAHRDALPVIRMQADVQNQGFAAGLAAARSAQSGMNMRQLDLRAIQRALVDAGILVPEVLTHQDSFPLSKSVLKTALNGPADLFNTAVIFAHVDESIPELLKIFSSDADSGQKERAALLLGLMGRVEAAPMLVQVISQRAWDDGWNYRGMGQFGMSLSPVDALVIALGKTRSTEALVPLIEKIKQLNADSFFSHCRAVAIASLTLADAQLALPLYQLLTLPGMAGHAQTDTRRVLSQTNNDGIETAPRNLSLRELYLARALYLCGDHQGAGKKILESYCHDLRGHLARHAWAVLHQASSVMSQLHPDAEVIPSGDACVPSEHHNMIRRRQIACIS